MRFAAVTLLLGLAVPAVAAAGSQAAAQPAAPVPAAAAQAYYEFMLARHLENTGDETGALAALKRAEAADPKAAEIKAEIAGFYARQNKAAEAVDFAEQALKLDPETTEGHRILGLVYSAWSDGGVTPPAGRTPAQLRQEAIDHLSKILNTPAMATDLNLQLTLGRLYMRAGSAAQAIPILENIVSQAPFALEPYTLLAEARMATGKTDEAIDALERAAEIDPRRYAALGDLYEKTRKWAEAAEAYGKAVVASRAPSRDLRLRLAGALLNTPDGAGKARDVLQELLKTTPTDAPSLYLLMSANDRLGDVAGAEDTARKLIAIDPLHAPALNYLGYLLADHGLKLPEAVTLIERALKIEPDNPAYLDSLGWALFKQGKFVEAEPPLRKAAEALTDASVIQDHFGDVLARRGKNDEAISAWERALKGDGEDIDRQAVEKKIKDARSRKK